MIVGEPGKPTLLAVFRKCQECDGDVLVRWTPDGPDPAPKSCAQHSQAGTRKIKRPSE